MNKALNFLLALIICTAACKKIDTGPETATTPEKNASGVARERKEPCLYFGELQEYEDFLGTAEGTLPGNAPGNFIPLRTSTDQIERLMDRDDSVGYFSCPCLADSLYQGYGKLLDVLNTDKIVNLFGNFVRVDLEKERVYTISERVNGAYDILLNDPENQQVKPYGMTDEVALILAGKSTGCGESAAPKKKSDTDAYCNTWNRTKKEVTYQSVGIYFSLVAEAKNQKKQFGIWWANGGNQPLLYMAMYYKQKCGYSVGWWYGDASAWGIAFSGSAHKSTFRPYSSATSLTTYNFGSSIHGNCGINWLQIVH